MNFFVNQAMGIGNSGVEHAEFYRAKRFDQAGLPYRFVFVELIKNLHDAMNRWNLKPDQVINMWEYFVLGPDYGQKGLQKTIQPHSNMVIDDTQTNRMMETVTDSGLRINEYYVKRANPEKPETLLVSLDRVELFNEATGQRKATYRVQKQPKHDTEIVNIHLFAQPDGAHLYFENIVQLKRYFFTQLDALFEGKSTFIIDRGEANEVALMNAPERNWNLVDVIHADHLSDRKVASAPLWNNYYEYVLTHMNQINRLVVATELQRQDLLIDFPDAAEKIVTIPVGGVSDDVNEFQARQLGSPLKLVTISRLAAEKHIDLIIKAVIELHQEGKAVTLDIYGQGGEMGKLQKAIQDGDAGDYIQLKGQTNHPEQVYPQYDAFISASYSEGFGLTYIEAMNAALPVITFDARFGALELVHDEQNGFLQHFKRDDEAYNISQLKAGIERLLAVKDYSRLQTQVVASVSDYRDQVIADKWGRLINEL
ncbi:glycosyltransferase [Lactobacillus selangorensis]|uniref:Glycosyltransferase n=1 Tax=Lactobacillus selangorensis TaxID=81857 RepID=A0A0R2FHG6_9LACO|nr:glycosyltransferase [Lactobacillus selangorensis]KRN27694.1 glycosyltransferase [Lactobacillus selangorensis]KRN30341.1 glycosyltransferase [Lactobacillus selangorensis]